MDQTAHNQTAQNRQQQIDLYGEPLGDLLRRIGAALGLNQAQLAATVGLSAPMLSQLMSAQRVKIGNPAVLTRLHSLEELAKRLTAGDPTAGELSGDAVARELEQIRGSTGTFARPATTAAVTRAPAGRAVVREIQDLLRSVASADEVRLAAERIAADSPALAEFLRVYGTGRTDDAVAHYEHHHG